MPAYIRKKELKNGTTVVQVEYRHGQKRTGFEHIGTAHNEVELAFLYAAAKEIKFKGQLSFDFGQQSIPRAKLLKTCSELLWNTLGDVYNSLGFSFIDDDVFRQLVLTRIIEPASKLDTIRILNGLGVDAPSNTSIHRCLRRIIDNRYRDIISNICFKHCSASSLTFVLYDVTTLYFETDKEDGYRIPGLSKERRLEPQITVGLLVNSFGYPLEIKSFEGNKAEVKTIIPVLNSFKNRHGLTNITVVADAAMISAKNIEQLEGFGYNYIIGSKLSKTPYDIDIQLDNGVVFTDTQIFDIIKTLILNSKYVERREIFQYKQKRASLDLLNINKTIVKAQKFISGEANIKRNRFLKVSGDKRELNLELIEEAKKRAGIKGYITNLDIPPQQVIDAYHQLFRIEKAFRMSKSDLKARPVFHRKKDSIEAHLTIVFAALALSCHIEAKTGISIKKFVRTLEPVRSGVVSVEKHVFPIEADIADNIVEILKKLA